MKKNFIKIILIYLRICKMKKKVTFYDCLKKFKISEDLNHFSKINRKRNNIKIIKVFINWKFNWYVKLDKLNRNLHIETEEKKEVNLFTDY